MFGYNLIDIFPNFFLSKVEYSPVFSIEKKILQLFTRVKMKGRLKSESTAVVEHFF